MGKAYSDCLDPLQPQQYELLKRDTDMSSLITEDELKEWTGYKQRSKIEAFLRREKIPFTYGKGSKILVTRAAINNALGGAPIANPQPQDGFF